MQRLFERDSSSINMILLPGFVLIYGLMLNGCGSDKEPTGSVKGMITYDGSPLTQGLVNLYSDKRNRNF